MKHGIGYMPGGVEVRRKPLSDKEKEEAERYRAERRRCVCVCVCVFVPSNSPRSRENLNKGRR